MPEPQQTATGALSEALAPYRPDATSRGDAVNVTTRAIREAILDGVLAPDAWLREIALSEALGVSRTPVREALNRLEEEGLVARAPGAGARVTHLSFQDMSAVYQVRASLESLAASYIARQCTPQHLTQFESLQRRIEAATESFDMQSFHRTNIEFHHLLSVAANNAYISRLLSTVETAIRRFGTRSLTQERMAEVVQEHGAILAAIISRDPEAASEAAAKHATASRTSSLTRMLGEPL